MAFRSRARAGAVLLATATVTASLAVATTAPAGAVPAGRPGVSATAVAPDGSNAVHLTWRNPGAGGRVATVVRYAAGSSAPSSPTAGHAGGRPRATRTSLVVDGLHPNTRYAFALFTSYGHGVYGRRAVVRTTTAPDAARGLQPYAHGNTVTVTWRAPRRATYAGTVVRYATGGQAPNSPRAGTGVTLADPHADSARLTGLAPASTYAVAVWVRDRAGRYSTVATTRFTTPPVTGTATGTVAGTVTDDASHPLDGVDVLVVAGASAASWSTSTDAAGHYSLTVPAGGYTVVLGGSDATGGDGDAAGYQDDVQDATVTSGGTATVNGALAPGGEIDGRVTDKDGDPLSGVGISINSPSQYVAESGSFYIQIFAGSGMPTTGADGRFRLRGLSPLAEQVCYQPTAGPVTGGSNDAAGYVQRCEHRTVAVGAGDVRTLADAALLPAADGVVSGVVTGSSGHPLAGVIVDVVSHDPRASFDGGAFQTDASGHYRVGGLSAGQYDVCADPTATPLPPGSVGNATTCRFAESVTRGHVSTVDVTLRAAGALGGRLTGPSGRAEWGFASVQSEGGVDVGFAGTDRHGQYVVPDLAPGRYRVCFVGFDASGPGAQPGCYRDGDLVQVRRGVIRLGVDARLSAGGAVSGHLSGFGSPDNVIVEADDPNGDGDSAGVSTVDGAGNYRVTGLPAGHYEICASSFLGEGFACSRDLVAVRVGHVTTGVDLAVPVGGTITTTVTNEAGRPVSGVDVAVVAACPDGECFTVPGFDPKNPVNVVASDMTDASGRIRLTVPPAGSYAVCAFTYYGAATAGDPSTGYLDACTSYGTFGVSVHKGHDTAEAFTLHPAGAVSGRVTDAAGHPLAGVRIGVSESSSSDYYDLSDYGDVVDFSVPGPALDVTTDADGRYVVPAVHAGTRSVCFDAGSAVDATGTAHPNGILSQCVGGKPGALDGPKSVTVPDAGTVTGVDQQLVDAAVITGRLVDRTTGRPIKDAVALEVSGQQVLADAAPNSKGYFRITGAAPGTVTVCFAAYEHQSQCYDDVPWPGKTFPTNATPVHVGSGATVTLKDARLRRG